MKYPCRNCFERKLLCHSFCEKYKGYRAEMDRIIKERQKKNDAYNTPDKKSKKHGLI